MKFFYILKQQTLRLLTFMNPLPIIIHNWNLMFFEMYLLRYNKSILEMSAVSNEERHVGEHYEWDTSVPLQLLVIEGIYLGSHAWMVHKSEPKQGSIREPKLNNTLRSKLAKIIGEKFDSVLAWHG